MINMLLCYFMLLHVECKNIDWTSFCKKGTHPLLEHLIFLITMGNFWKGVPTWPRQRLGATETIACVSGHGVSKNFSTIWKSNFEKSNTTTFSFYLCHQVIVNCHSTRSLPTGVKLNTKHKTILSWLLVNKILFCYHNKRKVVVRCRFPPNMSQPKAIKLIPTRISKLWLFAGLDSGTKFCSLSLPVSEFTVNHTTQHNQSRKKAIQTS